MSIRTIMLAGIAAVACVAAAAAHSPEEHSAICSEAEARYVELNGKPSSSEPQPVILMFKHTFCPAKLTVKQGTPVRFLNVDKRTSHSFWFRDAGRPESERYFQNEGAVMVMDLPPGDHEYLCGPHWEKEKMIGVISVTP